MPNKTKNKNKVITRWDLTNIHGAPLCHAIGCRKHKKIQPHRKGLFCPKHQRELDEIRQYIEAAKVLGDIATERVWRQKEIDFRKMMDEGHLEWQRHLMDRLQPMWEWEGRIGVDVWEVAGWEGEEGSDGVDGRDGVASGEALSISETVVKKEKETVVQVKKEKAVKRKKKDRMQLEDGSPVGRIEVHGVSDSEVIYIDRRGMRLPPSPPVSAVAPFPPFYVPMKDPSPPPFPFVPFPPFPATNPAFFAPEHIGFSPLDVAFPLLLPVGPLHRHG
ncbi:hypothetical protein HDV00_001030 [Rhizophlyctis rosea]|nr:hypothetical protein HDV00_001030 [Rhizophlyctis rosea]